MLRPSYSELMDQLNDDMDLDNKITSRYTIVIAASKRARQIINGAPCDKEGVATDKAVSIAVNEMNKGLIKIFPEGLPEDEDANEAAAPVETVTNTVVAKPEVLKEEITTFDDSIFDGDDFDEQFDDEEFTDVYNAKADEFDE